MKLFTPPFSREDSEIIKNRLYEPGTTIIYPTETFYALGCLAVNSEAVKKIYRIKWRDSNLPLLLLVNSWEMLQRYAADIGDSNRRILERHWPGPLTAVLNTRKNLPAELNLSGDTLGFRMTSSKTARDLIGIVNVPIVGTSANRSKGPDSASFQAARAVFGDEVDIYIDGGKTHGLKPSTIVDMTGESPKVLRKGMIDIS